MQLKRWIRKTGLICFIVLTCTMLFAEEIPVKLSNVSGISLGDRKVKGKMAILNRVVKGEQQKLLCFGSGPDLYIYDISNPSSPEKLLEKDFTGDTVNHENDVFEVIQSGNYLVLAGSFRSGGSPKIEPENHPFQMGFIQILDISDPDPNNWHVPETGARGRWASFWEDDHCWTCNDVALEGEVGKESCFLHVSGNLRPVDHCGGAIIIDLSDPANPRKRGDIKWTKDGKYMGHGVDFDGRYQYHGNYFMGVYVVDYQDPDNLKAFKPHDYPYGKDATRSVIKIGKYLYATVTVGNRNYYHNTNAGIATFDVTDPSDARLLSQTPVPIRDRPGMDDFASDAPPHKIHSIFNDRYLLINMGIKGIAAFDRGKNPAEPEYVGLVDMDVVPVSARPFIWDDEIWVIGDGPTNSEDNYVYIYNWELH